MNEVNGPEVMMELGKMRRADKTREGRRRSTPLFRPLNTLQTSGSAGAEEEARFGSTLSYLIRITLRERRIVRTSPSARMCACLWKTGESVTRSCAA